MLWKLFEIKEVAAYKLYGKEASFYFVAFNCINKQTLGITCTISNKREAQSIRNDVALKLI